MMQPTPIAAATSGGKPAHGQTKAKTASKRGYLLKLHGGCNLMIRKCMAIVCLLLCVFVVAACQSSPEAAFVGKWQSSDGTVQFFDDGTVVITGRDLLGEFELTGTYSVIDDENIRLNFSGGAMVNQFTLSGDKLTLVDQGDATNFTRVP